MNKKLLLAITVMGISLNSIAAKTPYMLLKDRRQVVSIPKYGLKEKALILNQARLVIKHLFVHKRWKLQHYGSESNILPLFDQLETKLADLDEMQFHSEMRNIFRLLHDFHTSYQLPKPYACFRNLLPVSFREVDGKILVGSVVKNEEVLKLLPSDLKVNLGDEVIAYNNKPTQEVINQNSLKSFGANRDAIRRDAIFMMDFISQKFFLAPKEDEVRLTLKKASGEITEVSLPWISKPNEECLSPSDDTGNNALGSNEDQLEKTRFFRTKKFVRKSFSSKDQDGYEETKEPTVKWKTIKNSYGTFGVLRIDSFIPEKLKDEETIDLIKEILSTKLSSTDGLIIDLRNNGGGYIRLGEELVQLFTPAEITPLNFLIKANVITKHYFDRSGGSFAEAINEALELQNEYTKAIPLNPALFMNNRGQAYFKPVAVFNNSACYSTCDMMSAQMQDHNSAVLISEDNTTGAGGANNIDHATLVKRVNDKSPFEALPEGQNLGFSWRQTVRVGKNNGKLIEDIGVLADHSVPASYLDTVSDSSAQFTKISKILRESAPHLISEVYITEDINIPQNEPTKVFMSWKNTDQIQLRQDGKVISSFDIENNNEGRLVDFSSVIKTDLLSKSKFEILGFLKGTRVWRKFLSVKVVPETLQITGSSTVSSDAMALYENIAGAGWNYFDSTLRISDGSNYLNNLKAEASFFVRINSSSATLNYDLTLKSEKDFDFFKVIVIDDGKENVLEKGLSGNHEKKTYTFDLTSFIGKDIEIRFLFESDGAVAAAGATLQNVNLVTN